MEETLTGHIRLEDNPADLLTQIVTSTKRKCLVSLVLSDIFDGNAEQSMSTFFLVLAKPFHVLIM